MNSLFPIPTNVIMGFLGVGKTSAILSLFAAKPENRRWAVLVNEFGEVGIDGEIYQAHGISVKEVPGGCVCCVQGVPMQVAINRLIKQTRPQRLIIETSGIGHPGGILRSLRGENYSGVLQLRASIALVDPQKLLDPCYLEHDLFKEQLALADVLVANKVDLASLAAMQCFASMAESFSPAKAVVAETVQGRIDSVWLDLESTRRGPAFHALQDAGADGGTDYQSHGWRPDSGKCYCRAAVERWIGGLPRLGVLRVKGVLPSDDGTLLFNAESGRVTVTPLPESAQARIEVLGPDLDAAELELGLSRCVVGG